MSDSIIRAKKTLEVDQAPYCDMQSFSSVIHCAYCPNSSNFKTPNYVYRRVRLCVHVVELLPLFEPSANGWLIIVSRRSLRPSRVEVWLYARLLVALSRRGDNVYLCTRTRMVTTMTQGYGCHGSVHVHLKCT